MRKKFKRIILSIVATLIVISAFTAVTSADTPLVNNGFPPSAVQVDVTLNGRQILEGETVIINSITYVPLRSFSELAGAEKVSWNASSRTATVTYNGRDVHITDGGMYVYSENRFFFTVEKILNIKDRLYVPIRPIAATLGLDVTWDEASRLVKLTSNNARFLSAREYYDSDDLYWLARIISAEARGESLEGKIAVGNVVLNRRASKNYPNTIYGVIFDRKGGTQFSPVAYGTIYQTPTEESVIAAKICLEGYSVSNRILFFMNPSIATNNWISKNRPFAFRIGNHNFYY